MEISGYSQKKKSMKLGIVGYGKMGRTIHKLALQRGHQVVAVIDMDSQDKMDDLTSRNTDVVIEFTQPEAAPNNLSQCLKLGIPVVSGTTGWLDHFPQIEELCRKVNGALFYASNYSIGVNIFFALNRQLAQMMKQQQTYQIQMKEIHHTEKLDTPSGTAITLAEDILGLLERKKKWVNYEEAEIDELSIISERINQVPGTHIIEYASTVDSLEIKHTAHSRIGFASGALDAAEWLVGKQGVYTMKDMLGF